MRALIHAAQQGEAGADVRVVISNRPGALALERARELGVDTAVVDHTAFTDRAEFEAALLENLLRHGVEVVCLAGFMRILGRAFIDAFEGRVLNVHPSLLPAFPGLHAARQALECGTRVAGCTVHLVTEEMDAGPILSQATVPVYEDDTEASLQARIQVEEHRVYPMALDWICQNRVVFEGRRARIQEQGDG
jgi:phosphoribosylglycinamide formyltransferase-1